MQNTVVNINGTCLPSHRSNEGNISVFDRSFLYGDSLYEVIRTYNGRFVFMPEHLRRLRESAKLCHLKIKQSDRELSHYVKSSYAEFCKLYAKNLGSKTPDAYIRIVVSRGTGKIGFGLNNLLTPTTVVTYVLPLTQPTKADFEKGYTMRVVKRLRNDPRALDPAMKSGNYLNSLLAYLEAQDEGDTDALLVNHMGFLTEGTTFNIFYAKNGIVATPPLDIGILDGITRRQIIQEAKKLGIEVREIRFTKERLYEADEVFLSSTLKDAFPITYVDGKKIANGKPGPITRKLKKAMVGFYEKNFG